MGDALFPGSMVGSGGRVGVRVPLGPPLVVAGRIPPPAVMRQLPTDAALAIAMMARGYAGPDYRMGKTLAKNRRALEKIWAEGKSIHSGQ